MFHHDQLTADKFHNKFFYLSQDTNITCDRKRCTRSICNNRISGKRRGITNAQNHEIDECCSNQCRRSRRHQNQKRYHRENSERQSNPNKS